MPSNSHPHSFLPNFCAVRMVFAWLLSAELLALALAMAKAPNDFLLSLGLHSLYVQWIALSLALLVCWLRQPLSRLRHAQVGVLVWLLGLGITSSAFILSQQLFPFNSGLSGRDLGFHLGITSIVLAMALRYLYEVYRQREAERAEAAARATALQARIRPHFLFNSMNTIASLTRTDAHLAEEVTNDLADLFRASLTDTNKPFTLQQELALAEGYLRIEQQRLGDRLQVIWDIQDLPQDTAVPALLLQPLLENAVRHGIEPAIQGGKIYLFGQQEGNKITLSITNTLSNKPGKHGNGIAQDNVCARLKAHYAHQGGMRITQDSYHYRVEIWFPGGT